MGFIPQGVKSPGRSGRNDPPRALHLHVGLVVRRLSVVWSILARVFALVTKFRVCTLT